MKPLPTIFVLTFIFLSCQNKSSTLYYPERPNDMSSGYFNKYKLKLDTAYLQNDNFEIGIQLANLKAGSDRVYPPLNKGIKAIPANCSRIYDWYHAYKNKFQNNIVKVDTNAFLISFNLCTTLLGSNSYVDYQSKKIIEYQKKKANRTPLDTTKFDLDLIEKLKQIRIDDQLIRTKLADQGVKEMHTHPLWNKQKELDSINMNKIENILKHGFPSKDKIGYEYGGTIWLVLHHQSNLKTRLKYYPILEQAVKEGNLGKGALKSYNWRNELIMLNNHEEP